MAEDKVKINIRVGIRIRELLEGEAAFEDVRTGSLTNRLLQEELKKMVAVGATHCIMQDSKEYKEKILDIEADRSSYYILPRLNDVERYISTKLDNKNYPQISLYFTSQQVGLMKEIVQKQRIRSTVVDGKVKSYRYVIIGMLLNHPLCRKLEAAADGRNE